MIPKGSTPAIQAARFRAGDNPLRTNPCCSYAPEAPRASRIDQRPAALTGWGMYTGLGYETDRLAVPVNSSSFNSGAKMALCGALGFLAYQVMG